MTTIFIVWAVAFSVSALAMIGAAMAAMIWNKPIFKKLINIGLGGIIVCVFFFFAVILAIGLGDNKEAEFGMFAHIAVSAIMALLSVLSIATCFYTFWLVYKLNNRNKTWQVLISIVGISFIALSIYCAYIFFELI